MLWRDAGVFESRMQFIEKITKLHLLQVVENVPFIGNIFWWRHPDAVDHGVDGLLIQQIQLKQNGLFKKRENCNVPQEGIMLSESLLLFKGWPGDSPHPWWIFLEQKPGLCTPGVEEHSCSPPVNAWGWRTNRNKDDRWGDQWRVGRSLIVRNNVLKAAL